MSRQPRWFDRTICQMETRFIGIWFRSNTETWNRNHLEDAVSQLKTDGIVKATVEDDIPKAIDDFNLADQPLKRRTGRQFDWQLLFMWKLRRIPCRNGESFSVRIHNCTSKNNTYIHGISYEIGRIIQGTIWRERMSSHRPHSRPSHPTALLWPWRHSHKVSPSGLRPSKVLPRHITCPHLIFVSLSDTGRTH